MSALRSALFALTFWPVTAFFVFLSFPAALIGDRTLHRCVRGWARAHRFLATNILGITSRIEGALPAGPVLLAAKHQSMFETLEVLLLIDAPVIVVKRELTEIPFWGWVVRLHGVIPIDRAGGASALRSMLRAAAAARASGRPLVIFPEGTRVPPGATPPLQPGFAGLYRALGLPVVPLALDSGRLWPRRRFAKHPGIVTYRFGKTIPPGLDRAEIEARVHRGINALELTAG